MNKLGYDHKMERWTTTKSHAMMTLVAKCISNHLYLQNVVFLFYELKPISAE